MYSTRREGDSRWFGCIRNMYYDHHHITTIILATYTIVLGSSSNLYHHQHMVLAVDVDHNRYHFIWPMVGFHHWKIIWLMVAEPKTLKKTMEQVEGNLLLMVRVYQEHVWPSTINIYDHWWSLTTIYKYFTTKWWFGWIKNISTDHWHEWPQPHPPSTNTSKPKDEWKLCRYILKLVL